MNIEEMWLLVALIAGMLLGLSYFGGLWFTIRRLPATGSPMFLILSSFLVRTGVSLLGFYLVMDHHWERLLVCMVGFVVIRSILVQRWGMPQDTLKYVKG
jgi:F1F0 ATPase subunit 2